jgi:hypothetical protein
MKKLFLTGIAALFLATGMMIIAARAVAADRADAPTEQQCSNRYAPGAHNDEQSARATYEHCLEDAKSMEPIKPAAFRPWQQVWQCNDIRIVEFSNRQGLIEYDLSGSIWGGSQFARDLNRDMLFFNGRPCLKVAR